MSIAVRVFVAVVLLLAGGSLPVSAALDADSFRCQNTFAKQGKKLLAKEFRALAKCENKISKDILPVDTDCTIEPGTAPKLAYAEGKFTDKVLADCTDTIVMNNLDFGGACLGVTTEADLVTCGLAEHRAAAQKLIGVLYPRNICTGGGRSGDTCATNADCPGTGSTCTPVNSLTDPDQLKCQKLAAKTVLKETTKRLTQLQKCKKLVAKDRLAPDTNCVTSAQVKLGEIITQSRAKIAGSCPSGVTAPQAVAGVCAGETALANVQACSLCAGDHEADDLLLVQYGSSAHGTVAVAQQITDTADCVGGPLSRCRINDYLLANDKIRVVIQDVQRNLFGIGQFGGQIIDADLVRVGLDPDRDNFEEWSVSLNIENTAHYTSLTVINDGSNGGAAIIRATGVDDLLDFLNPSSVVASFGFTFPAAADDLDLPVTITTDYTLEPGKNYVRVDTSIQNISAGHLDIFFGEFLNGSGEVEVFQPGNGFGEPLVTSGCPTAPAVSACYAAEPRRNFVAYGGHGDGAGVSYGYIHNVPMSTTFSTSGVTVPQLGVEIVLALIGAATAPFDLEAQSTPGDSLTFTRYFAVGKTISSVTDIRNEIQCEPTGTLQGTVTADGSPVEGADVTILGSLAAAPNGFAYNVVTHTLTDNLGNYSLTLPPGNYNVIANLDGYPYDSGTATPTQHPVTITAFGTATQNVSLPATGSLQVEVVDEDDVLGPGKVSVVGFDPSPDIVNTQLVLIINTRTGLFGDFEDERPFGIAKTLFVDPTGDSGVLPLEPADYEIVVSRGTEYSTYSTGTITVSASPAPATMVDAKVEHVIDTDGFISGDFHVHAIHSADSEVPMTDRVLTMLGEGLDFFTPSEHDIRVDYQPTIDALGADNLLGTAVSGEITTFDYGHFNAWPMTVDAGQVNGGTVDHGGAATAGQDFPTPYNNYSLSPAQIIAAANLDPGTNTVQINHVHSHFGLDGGSGLAIDTGVEPPQSAVPGGPFLGWDNARRLDPSISNLFTDTFDALEIWIGDSRSQIRDNFLGQVPSGRGGNIGDWFNMINQGILSTGIADSDTHNTLQNVAGIPRSMVASPDDDPGDLGALADTLSANVNAGRVVGTNGPMVRVTATADSTGQVAGLELGMPTTIVTTNGEVEIEVEIQSPEWARFDRVEYYINTTTTRRTIAGVQTGAGPITLRRYTITADEVQNVTPTLQPVSGWANRWEASTSLSLTGLTEDIWVVVLVKGTDGLSEPLFPVVPNDLRQNTNTTLANLTDGNLGEDGITALAFTNPLFIDVDGGGWSAPGVQVSNP